jgi:hypothetical protein
MIARPRPREKRGGGLDSESAIIWGLLFGSVGLGYFIYGRKQRRVIPLLAGLGLMVCPYFVPNAILLVLLCIVFMALPYFVRI